MTIQIKATEKYLSMLLFVTFYKIDLSFESVDEGLKYDDSNEKYWDLLSNATVCYTVQDGSNF